MIDRRVFLGLLAGAAVWRPAYADIIDDTLETRKVFNRLRDAITFATAKELIRNLPEIRTIVQQELPSAIDAGIEAIQATIEWKWFDIDRLDHPEELLAIMAQYWPVATHPGGRRSINDGHLFSALMTCSFRIEAQGRTLVDVLDRADDHSQIQIDKAILGRSLAHFDMLLAYLVLLRMGA